RADEAARACRADRPGRPADGGAEPSEDRDHPGFLPDGCRVRVGSSGVPELAIRLRNVVKRYGPITAVAGLDVDVPAGTCVGLLGPNGAGKSTTMRLLTGQAIADEGVVEVLGFRLPADSKQ